MQKGALFYLYIETVLSGIGGILFKNNMEYIVKLKQQQDISQACLKQDIQVSRKIAKKHQRQSSRCLADAETLAYFFTNHFHKCSHLSILGATYCKLKLVKCQFCLSHNSSISGVTKVCVVLKFYKCLFSIITK